MIVYISSVGYFQVVSVGQGASKLRLQYLYSSETDSSLFIRSNDLIIPSGARGSKGESGIKGEISVLNLINKKTEDKVYLASSLPKQTLYLQENDDLIEMTNIHHLFSNQIREFSKNCEEGQTLLSGSCDWNLFSYKLEHISCHKKEEESCLAVSLSPLTPQESKDCGFFCFFYHLEPIIVSNTTFTCKYIPPSHYGINHFGFALGTKKHRTTPPRLLILSINTLCARFY